MDASAKSPQSSSLLASAWFDVVGAPVAVERPDAWEAKELTPVLKEFAATEGGLKDAEGWLSPARSSKREKLVCPGWAAGGG